MQPAYHQTRAPLKALDQVWQPWTTLKKGEVEEKGRKGKSEVVVSFTGHVGVGSRASMVMYGKWWMDGKNDVSCACHLVGCGCGNTGAPGEKSARLWL